MPNVALPLLLCVACAGSVMSLSPVNAMALPGAAGAHPLRLKGGAVERCTSAEDAAGGGKIVESAEMAALNHCHQSIEIDATPEECFAAASGFEDYPKWAGAMKKVNVLKRQGGGLGTVVEWTMGILNLVDRPVFKYSYDRSRTEMKWHTNEPSTCIKDLQGRYTFTAKSTSKTSPTTTVHYKLSVEPRIPFPAFVKKVINAAVAKQALKELKSYTEKQRKAKQSAQAQPADAASVPEAKPSFMRRLLSVFGA